MEFLKFDWTSEILNKNTILERELATENDLIIELKTAVTAFSFIATKEESIELFIEGYKQECK